MFHGSSQDVGNRLDAAMRMPWETGCVIGRNVVAEVVEQQKRVEIRGVAKAERAAQMHTGAFERWFRSHKPLDRSNGHVGLPRRESHASSTNARAAPNFGPGIIAARQSTRSCASASSPVALMRHEIELDERYVWN